ncbi:uncharacterized protein DC041_0008047 [Schistosoma bovis]|uniref:SCP domain-containing protein n=1 Tax=Schistosoma bovis TaxID=6184 RepID=A0A430QP11_SCHBO|nr:uncharacterized protein DC041_0008047 [Schistosoma bovis]
MNEWVNEHNHYNFDNNTCTTSCGNYVQIWDNELALKAAALSKTCNFRFSNVTTKKFKDVGQNIAAYASVEMYIVWHGTTHIGCGVTYCRKTRRFPYGVFVVCNYAPG